MEERNNTYFYMTRKSICFGDDCDAPHLERVDFPSHYDKLQFQKAIIDYLYWLGPGRKWLGFVNGKEIATFYIGREDENSYIGVGLSEDWKELLSKYRVVHFVQAGSFAMEEGTMNDYSFEEAEKIYKEYFPRKE